MNGIAVGGCSVTARSVGNGLVADAGGGSESFAIGIGREEKRLCFLLG